MQHLSNGNHSRFINTMPLDLGKFHFLCLSLSANCKASTETQAQKPFCKCGSDHSECCDLHLVRVPHSKRGPIVLQK